jgi:hypothetical protein
MGATTYHASVKDFRRGLVESADMFHEFKDKHSEAFTAAAKARREGQMDAHGAPSDAYTASLMAGHYAYTLAAILSIAEREFGEQVADRLANAADNILMNGDDHDCNADVMPAVDAGREGGVTH